ncbi:MAG: hypothetical protein HRT88_23730 [Lentisphaeraceae bacterium]|nr:hypothetical protein [Lentisphaeraceae bacterium]
MPAQSDEEMKKRFDVKMLNLMISLIENTKQQKALIKGVMKTAEDLRNKASIPSIQKKLPLLDRIVEKEFWKDVTLGTVDYVRRELRDLMTLLEKDDVSQKIYFSDFKDEVMNPHEEWDDGDDFGDEFLDYKEGLRRYFMEHPKLESVWKLQNNKALEDKDLKELESIIFSSEVSDEELFKENCDGKSIKAFVRSLTGMDKLAVADAFGDFLDKNSFNSKQIDCINIIIEHYVQNGFMQKTALQEQPFKGFTGGFIGLYGQDTAVKVLHVINYLNESVV